MAWSWVQGAQHNSLNAASTTATLSAAPTPGNIVVATLCGLASSLNPSVKDGNGNVYTVGLPTVGQPFSTFGAVMICYLIVGGGASVSVTGFALGSSGRTSLALDEFNPGGVGNIGLDLSLFSDQHSASSTNINTPTVTPNFANELIYVGATTGGGGTIDSPKTGSVQGGWIGGGSNISFVAGLGQEYAINVSSAMPVSFTASANSGWVTGVCSWVFTPLQSTEIGGVDNSGDYWLGGDEY